jgi:hypothetical protein
MKLPNVDEELILELLGIAYTNDTAASIPGGDIKIRLAFPISAMFSHDCLPNVVRHIGRKKDGFQLKGYAAKNIKKGEKLSISYVDLLLPTLIRQEILRKVSTLMDKGPSKNCVVSKLSILNLPYLCRFFY